MTFVNGELQARFMARIRGLDPQRCLAIPMDVGKTIAVALVADHYGEMVVAPFEFALTETGFAALSAAITRARHERDALVVRIGVQAGPGVAALTSCIRVRTGHPYSAGSSGYHRLKSNPRAPRCAGSR